MSYPLFSPPPPRRCKIDEEVTHKAWLNRSNILFAGTDKWSLDRRVSLVNSNTSDFSIQIERVEVADEGLYTCSFQASNKPRIAHVFLIVQGESLGTSRWGERWGRIKHCFKSQAQIFPKCLTLVACLSEIVKGYLKHANLGDMDLVFGQEKIVSYDLVTAAREKPKKHGFINLFVQRLFTG